MTTIPPQPRGRKDFTVAIICALAIEAGYVQLSMDTCWDDLDIHYGKAPGDQNAYTTGVIGRHNVVLAYMPEAGNTTAAAVATRIRSSFVGIQIALVVGICGAIPSPSALKGQEVLLGDVFISTAVIQYDVGKTHPGGFVRKASIEDSLGRSSSGIGAYMTKLDSRPNRKKLKAQLEENLAALQSKEPEAIHPGAARDRLYKHTYVHRHRKGMKTCPRCKNQTASCPLTCDALGCEEEQLIARDRLTPKVVGGIVQHTPSIHFGRFGSANTVMKSGKDRDKIAEADGIIALEMEAAGVWDRFPTVVIKAGCDYADSHKNDDLHEYAAAAAAACMKAFLKDYHSSGQDMDQVPINTSLADVKITNPIRENDQSRMEFLRKLSDTDPVADKNALKRQRGGRVAGTCEWIAKEEAFTAWSGSEPNSSILWLYGPPGSGKTTVLMFVAEELLNDQTSSTRRSISYFFCDGSFEKRRSAVSILKGLLLQFARQDDILLDLIKQERDSHASFDDFDTLWITFMKAASDERTGRKYCIIDALDECDSESQVTLLSQLRQSFPPDSPSTHAPSVRILISSRQYQEIECRLSHFQNIGIQDQPRLDIELFIRERLAIMGPSYPSSIKDRVTSILRNNTDGTFLWIGLACQELDGVAAKDVLRCLRSMPKGLHPLYKKLLADAISSGEPKAGGRCIVT